MVTHYRIIAQGHNTFYVESGRPFLLLTLWTRVRDAHAREEQGYTCGRGSCVRYNTKEAAAEAIAYLQEAAAGYAWEAGSLAY